MQLPLPPTKLTEHSTYPAPTCPGFLSSLPAWHFKSWQDKEQAKWSISCVKSWALLFHPHVALTRKPMPPSGWGKHRKACKKWLTVLYRNRFTWEEYYLLHEVVFHLLERYELMKTCSNHFHQIKLGFKCPLYSQKHENISFWVGKWKRCWTASNLSFHPTLRCSAYSVPLPEQAPLSFRIQVHTFYSSAWPKTYCFLLNFSLSECPLVSHKHGLELQACRTALLICSRHWHLS